MGIENPKGRKDPGEEKPIIKGGKMTFPGVEGVEWSHSTQEKLGPSWKPHVLPIGETDPESDWEQTAPIPTFRLTHKSKEGKVSGEYLLFSDIEGRHQVNTGGKTVDEAESKMRDNLPSQIAFNEGMLDVPLQEEYKSEVTKYFQKKPQEPQE